MTTNSLSTGDATDDLSEFSEVIEGLWAAWSRKDLSAIERLFTEDYIDLTLTASRTVGRAAAMDGVREFVSKNSIDSFAIADLMVQRLAEDAVVCSYFWSDNATIGGTKMSLRGAASEVLVRREGRWQIALHHETRSPES